MNVDGPLSTCPTPDARSQVSIRATHPGLCALDLKHVTVVLPDFAPDARFLIARLHWYTGKFPGIPTVRRLASGVSRVEEGATNRLDMIDPALLRPGRFDKVLSVPLPDMSSRKQILKVHTRGVPLSDDVDLDNLAQLTQFFSGADLENMCKEAGLISLREDINCSFVDMRHFTKALHTILPNIKTTNQQAFEFLPP